MNRSFWTADLDFGDLADDLRDLSRPDRSPASALNRSVASALKRAEEKAAKEELKKEEERKAVIAAASNISTPQSLYIKAGQKLRPKKNPGL